MPAAEAQYFRASYDSTAKVITAAVLVLFVAIAAATRSTAVAALGAMIFAASWAFSPRGYKVAERSIDVKRFIGHVAIPLEGVLEIRRAEPADFEGCIRLFGDGGLFGYYGLFRTSNLGTSTWYVTNRPNAIVVVTRAKTVLFSPDDVDGFIAAIRAYAPAPPHREGPKFQSLGSNKGNLTGTLLGTLVGLAALAAASFAMLYSPGAPRYTLTPESLTIHDRFYPVTLDAARVDVKDIRIVDLGPGSQWRPVARTNGFGNPHYQSGWFRVASGMRVRMYRAGSDKLVLLPPKDNGAAVLLQTREPEQFVRELRREWPDRP